MCQLFIPSILCLPPPSDFSCPTPRSNPPPPMSANLFRTKMAHAGLSEAFANAFVRGAPLGRDHPPVPSPPPAVIVAIRPPVPSCPPHTGEPLRGLWAFSISIRNRRSPKSPRNQTPVPGGGGGCILHSSVIPRPRCCLSSIRRSTSPPLLGHDTLLPPKGAAGRAHYIPEVAASVLDS